MGLVQVVEVQLHCGGVCRLRWIDTDPHLVAVIREGVAGIFINCLSDFIQLDFTLNALFQAI